MKYTVFTDIQVKTTGLTPSFLFIGRLQTLFLAVLWMGLLRAGP